MRATPPPTCCNALASTCSGTFSASSANAGVRTSTASVKRSGALCVYFWRRSGHCMEPNGSPPVGSSAAAQPGYAAMPHKPVSSMLRRFTIFTTYFFDSCLR